MIDVKEEQIRLLAKQLNNGFGSGGSIDIQICRAGYEWSVLQTA